MRTAERTRQRAVVVTAALLAGAACGAGGPKAPTRDEVLALLRQEAASMKRDGEKVDPSLGVTATWKIVSVDVAERPGDKEKPGSGTVKFEIEARTRDAGESHVDRIDKTFSYVFDATSRKWGVSVGSAPGR
jgi:hypothetical protein